MPKDVDQYVAENRQNIRQVDRRFIEVDSRQNRDLSFGPSTVVVDVAVELYKRPTGSQAVFGHASNSKGFGRGTFGDDRGAWSLLTDVEASAEFTKQGRKAVAEALNGKPGAAQAAVAGSDTSLAGTGDTALGAQFARADGFASAAANQTTVTTVFNSADWVGSAGEVGVLDGDDRLLCRVTVDPTSHSVAATDEVKGVVYLTFTGDGLGKSVITNDGEAAIAESMAKPKAAVGPVEFAFGTGSTDFSKTDSALTTEQFRKDCDREPARDRVAAKTHVYKNDPDSNHNFDLSEMGVFDNTGTTGRMLWATTFRTYNKTDDDAFNAETTIVAR